MSTRTPAIPNHWQELQNCEVNIVTVSDAMSSQFPVCFRGPHIRALMETIERTGRGYPHRCTRANGLWTLEYRA